MGEANCLLQHFLISFPSWPWPIAPPHALSQPYSLGTDIHFWAFCPLSPVAMAHKCFSLHLSFILFTTLEYFQLASSKQQMCNSKTHGLKWMRRHSFPVSTPINSAMCLPSLLSGFPTLSLFVFWKLARPPLQSLLVFKLHQNTLLKNMFTKTDTFLL